MRLLGFEITRTKAATPTAIQPMTWPGSWWYHWPTVREPFTGAWQRNMELRPDSTLAYHAVYACATLIASDVSKMRIKLVEKDSAGIWSEVDRASPFWPVLRKPNRYQNRIQFLMHWIISKLLSGNTYVLKERNDANIVSRLYVLDPMRCKPMVADDGSVWYDLSRDPLSGIDEEGPIRIPASEIIHDRMCPLYHPLCGVSPVIAYGLAAMQGLNILNNSSNFFANNSQPGGILTAPGLVSDTTAKRLKDYWEANYTGANAGRIAVLGDGLKYEQMAVTAHDAQLIEQLKWSAETVCSAFHVPPYMIGVGPPPNYNNIEALNQQYYSQCLQTLVECIELCLDEGLNLVDVPGKVYGTELSIEDLLRMDTATKTKAAGDAIQAGFLAPNEARASFDLPAVKGGDTPYMQNQNYSLAALSDRDAGADPFGKAATAAPPQEPPEDDGEPPEDDGAEEKSYADSRSIVDQILARAKQYAVASSS